VKKAVGMSMEKAVASYIKASGVVSTGLDVKKLKRVGQDILAAARQEYENN
jgi:hypothetical protein